MRVAFHPDVVLPNLLVGPAPLALEHFQELQERGVQAILTLQPLEESLQGGLLPEVVLRLVTSLDMTLERVPIPDLDREALRAHLPSAVQRLDELLGKGKRVYLHCAIGWSRSPTVAACWIAWRRGMDASSACEFVRRARPSDPDVLAIEGFLGRQRRRV